MYRMTGGLLALLLALPAFGSGVGKDKDKDDKDKPATAAEQFKALEKEYSDAMQAFQKAYGQAKTNEERQKILNEKYPQPAKLAPKFLELAEKNPKDAAAVDALVWVVTHSFEFGAKESPRDKAVAILTRDHLENEKLGQVCHTLVYSGDKASEALLRALLEKSPHKTVQGQACSLCGAR